MHLAIEPAFKDADPDFLAASEMDATGTRKGNTKVRAIDALVERHDNADVMAALEQGFAQARDDIAQSAGLGEWRAFRGDE